MASQITASSKGQVVLPKRTRDRLGIASGTVLDVIDTPAGVELRPAKIVASSSIDEALARLRATVRYDGPWIDEVSWAAGINRTIHEKWGSRDE